MNIPFRTRIVGIASKNPFKMGEEVIIFREYNDGTIDAMGMMGDCCIINLGDVINENDMKKMTDAVIDTAKRLCKAQNRVTTLEIKTEVMKTHSNYFWTQAFVSATMDTANQNGRFSYTNDPTNSFRVYSDVNLPKQGTVSPKVYVQLPKPKAKTSKTNMKTSAKVATVVVPKTKTISKTQALSLMENNRGHFFTTTSINKDGTIRIMNCQYLKDQAQSKLGYVRVKENILSKKLKNGDKSLKKSETGIRTVNMQTLLEIKIAGNSYKVK